MKTKLLTLFSLLALLLVSTAVLADGRPTGIRIGRAVGSGGSTTPTVEISVTVPGTIDYYSFSPYTVWIGPELGGDFSPFAMQYASGSFNYNFPYGIDWGDGYYFGEAPLYGPPGGPFQGAFSHTYAAPGVYTVTVGDAINGPPTSISPSGYITSGNVITGHTRYVWISYFGTYTYTTFGSGNAVLAVTNTATIRTGFGIPTLNIYGLLAMAFVLVGTGVLLFRRPQQA